MEKKKLQSICFWRIWTQKKGCFLVFTAIRLSSNDDCLNWNTRGTLTSAHSLLFKALLLSQLHSETAGASKTHGKYNSTNPESSVGHTGREKLFTRRIEMLCNGMKTSNPREHEEPEAPAALSFIQTHLDLIVECIYNSEVWWELSVRNQNKWRNGEENQGLFRRSWHHGIIVWDDGGTSEGQTLSRFNSQGKKSVRRSGSG